EMTKSLDSGGFFGSEAGSDFYQDMYIDSISDMMSKNQSLGLSDMIVRQLKNDYSKMPKNNSLELLQRKIEKRISEPVQSQQAQDNAALPKTLMARLDRYEPIINKAADKYDIDKSLIKAVIAQESYGNHKAVSPVGAKGLMQLMDGTANDLGVKDPFNPEENIMAGAKYLKQQLNKFKSNELALAAYNAGPGNVTRYNGVPPFKETKNYIRNVMRFKNTL
ncbi:MAG TPA: transglycosylase SLT domain-containing protein, partial [Candidatus Cloacimonadota bacterium]|nr:transglycosylase SLT domain-containing protein [Candidatus Cloacimonadota bacterium]